jgi:hypothetical protein
MAATIPHKFNIVQEFLWYCGGHFENDDR